MKKGYKETLPKRAYDDEGKPIWGYPRKGRKNVKKRNQKKG